MKFNFDNPPPRRGTNSLKWDEVDCALPMWVADMDFETAPCVKAAIEERARHGIYGYNIIPREWNEAISRWWQTRHDYKIDPDHLIFCTGVVPAISSLVRKLTTPNENVVLQTPVYNIFFNSVINSGRRVLEAPLAYKDGEYSIDFGLLESRLSDPQTSLMILCNPHNPVGKIWSADELKKIGELCKKHGVTVISDEIHCDLTLPEKSYTPFAAASETCADISITCVSATKAFNIAGLQTAAVFAKNEFLRHKAWRTLNTDEVAEPNTFAICATVAAFSEGGEWLDALREYIAENKKCAVDFIRKNLPQIKVGLSEATYLLWLDCGTLGESAEVLQKKISDRTGLYLSDGAQYGGNGGQFLRLNVACPRKVLQAGLEKLKQGLE